MLAPFIFYINFLFSDQTILSELEAAAQIGGVGIWANSVGPRNVSFTLNQDSRAFLEQYKGIPIDGKNIPLFLWGILEYLFSSI